MNCGTSSYDGSNGGLGHAHACFGQSSESRFTSGWTRFASAVLGSPSALLPSRLFLPGNRHDVAD